MSAGRYAAGQAAYQDAEAKVLVHCALGVNRSASQQHWLLMRPNALSSFVKMRGPPYLAVLFLASQ